MALVNILPTIKSTCISCTYFSRLLQIKGKQKPQKKCTIHYMYETQYHTLKSLTSQTDAYFITWSEVRITQIEVKRDTEV